MPPDGLFADAHAGILVVLVTATSVPGRRTVSDKHITLSDEHITLADEHITLADEHIT